jgi:hypothetical protein
VNFIAHGVSKTIDGTIVRDLRRLTQWIDDSPHMPPPKLPKQGIGPHVEINREGVITFPPVGSLDKDGNHLPRLRAMHPDICELARQLVAALCQGNVPHAVLSERVAAYAALIDQDLETVDFSRLYAAGVRLANAAYATERAISTKELPSLELPAREMLDSLLGLHGPFILSTVAGAEAMADEERYKRRPDEERRYRADAIATAQALQNRPDIIDPEVAEQVLGAAQDVGQGNNPERSSVIGRAMVRNVMISLVSGAIGSVTLTYSGPLLSGVGTVTAFVGALAISETIKTTQWFQSLTRSLAATADRAVDVPSQKATETFRASLHRHNRFVAANEPTLRRLAGKRKDLDFVHRALDWFNENASRSPRDPRA